MVKKESRLFARHWKEVQARLARKKRNEDVKRQEAFLDEAHKERLAQMSEEEGDEGWDPIEDAVEDERDSFVDLMKRLLWLSDASSPVVVEESTPAPSRDVQATPPPSGKENLEPNKGKTKNARKRAKAKAKTLEAPKDDALDDNTVKVEVNESIEDMRRRLIKGVRYAPSEGVKGDVIGGTIENHAMTIGRIPPIPAGEVDSILEEVAQIKLYFVLPAITCASAAFAGSSTSRQR